jgi:hypothetical protein
MPGEMWRSGAAKIALSSMKAKPHRDAYAEHLSKNRTKPAESRLKMRTAVFAHIIAPASAGRNWRTA